MNIKEASEKWKVKEQTILTYIVKGYIFNLSIENNNIIIPNINKPYIKKWKKDNIHNIDKIILSSLEKVCYTNYKIIGITEEQFYERLKVLEKENKIYPKKNNPCYKSNVDFVASGKVGNEISFNISCNPQININSQVGLINAKVK